MTDIIEELEQIEKFKQKKQTAFKSPDYREIFEEHQKQIPIYYDENKTWWVWDDKDTKWKYSDETDVLLIILKHFPTLELCKGRIRQEVLNGLKLAYRQREIITPKSTWVQFKNKIIDAETKEEIKLDNKYFFTNPIPYKIGEKEDTPIIDKLIDSWVGEEKRQLMYEIIAYCLIRDYPIHRIFCFTGTGRNGKSKYLGLINNFLGEDNTSTSDLDLLMSRPFESFKLYKKLVCQMGETNYEGLKRTAILKQLSGQDMISFERKGKDGFSDYNYAKLLISTNGIPITHDKSEGFYRRWLIIDFPNNFPEGKDILKSISKEEYENLCLKCINLLPNLLEHGRFNKEPTIEEKKEIYERKSNPLKLFLENNCEKSFDSHIFKYDFKDKFMLWLSNNGYRSLSNNEINAMMRDLYDENKRHKEKTYVWAWLGIKWKNSEDNSRDSKNSKDLFLSSRVENRVESTGISGISGSEIFLSSIKSSLLFSKEGIEETKLYQNLVEIHEKHYTYDHFSSHIRILSSKGDIMKIGTKWVLNK